MTKHFHDEALSTNDGDHGEHHCNDTTTTIAAKTLTTFCDSHDDDFRFDAAEGGGGGTLTLYCNLCIARHVR